MKNKQGRRVLPNLLNPTPEPKQNPVQEILLERLAKLTPESLRRAEEFQRSLDQEKEELEAIKANRPLGSVVPREPKSLHYSEVPKPVWKRKLRP